MHRLACLLLLTILLPGCASPHGPQVTAAALGSPEKAAAAASGPPPARTLHGTSSWDETGVCVPGHCVGATQHDWSGFETNGTPGARVLSFLVSSDGTGTQNAHIAVARGTARIAEAVVPRGEGTLAMPKLEAGAYTVELWPDHSAGDVGIKLTWTIEA